MLTLEQKKEKLRLLRLKKILKARKSFWEFQKINSPKDFKDERTYLLCLALCLQSFYEGKPVSYMADLPIEHHKKLDLTACTLDIELEDFGDKTLISVDLSDSDILIIEVPRRHHKSHSLINFEDWVFGKDPKTIMITAAHNADLANEFSQYVRDGIEQVRIKPYDIIYSDVFPFTRMKYGDRSKKRWSLEGSFLSYTGSGILTPVTGKGGSLGIFDDPIKGPLEAFNEKHLDKVWSAITNGWLSCLEKPRKQIHVMTPWITGDPGDRTVKGATESGEKVSVYNCKAWTEDQGMLCEDILDYRAYKILESRLDPIIFSGNYKSQRIGNVGKLYKSLRTYQEWEIPDQFDEIFCYIDTADEGSDYLFAGLAGITETRDENGFYLKTAHFLDVYGSQEGMEITEPATAKFLADNQRATGQRMKVMIESNNGGRGFARNVEKELEENYPEEYSNIHIEWFHQSENKKARINAESNTIMRFCLFPANWDQRWPEYFKFMNGYSRIGDNEFDDAPDMTTGIAEHINVEKSIIDIFNR